MTFTMGRSLRSKCHFLCSLGGERQLVEFDISLLLSLQIWNKQNNPPLTTEDASQLVITGYKRLTECTPQSIFLTTPRQERRLLIKVREAKVMSIFRGREKTVFEWVKKCHSMCLEFRKTWGAVEKEKYRSETMKDFCLPGDFLCSFPNQMCFTGSPLIKWNSASRWGLPLHSRFCSLLSPWWGLWSWRFAKELQSKHLRKHKQVSPLSGNFSLSWVFGWTQPAIFYQVWSWKPGKKGGCCSSS